MNKKRNKKIKIACVFGTRPETIKIYPVLREMGRYPNWIERYVIITAQHREMLDQMLKFFHIIPDCDLDVMKHGQSLSQINARALTKLEESLERIRPDLVLVQGDTTTTFSGALAAFYQKMKVGHIEAGLRTTKKYYPFPEEMNRRLTTVLADYHFTPTEGTAQTLMKEGISRKNIFISGNTVIDTLMLMQKKDFHFCDQKLQSAMNKENRLLLVTMHRRENWGRPLENLCQALLKINQHHEDLIIVFPVHKNPSLRTVVSAYLGDCNNIILTDTLDYQEMANLMRRSMVILTDSGGIQEEAPALGKPVLITRTETERPEIIKIGAGKLVGIKSEKIISETEKLLNEPNDYQKMVVARSPYGDGQAAERIVQYILYRFHYLEHLPREFSF